MKRIIAVVISILLLANMAACNSGTSNKDSKLKILYADYDINTKNFVSRYLKDNEKSSGISFMFGQDKQIEKVLTAGTKAEDMPDVLILPYSSLPKLSKYIEAGTFLDINELITKDSSFSLSDYNTKILDSGVYSGKRYVIPLNYSVNVLATTREILEKYNISKDWTKLSIDQFKSTAKEYKSKNQSDYFLDMLDFYTLMSSSDKAFIDMKNKKAEFNTDEFKNLADCYSELNQSLVPMDQLLKLNDEKNRFELLKNGEVAMVTTYVAKINDLYKAYMTFDKEVEPVILPLPYNSDKVHIIALPMSFVAISSSCSDKKAAFELVKELMGQEYQESDDAYGLPVNINAFKVIKKKALENKDNRASSCKSDTAAKSIINQFDKIVDAIDKVNETDFELTVKLQGIIYNATKGSGDLKSIAGELQSKFNEYMEEKVGEAANAKTDSSLSIYYMNINNYIDNAISTFSRKYGNIKINTKVFYLNGAESYYDFTKTISTEVLSGGGPDLIVFDPLAYFDSINKVLDSGAFADLDELISKDSDFKLSNYNSRVINAGVYNGKRLFLPTYYRLPVFCTTENILKQNGIDIKNDCSVKELSTIVESFLNNKSRKSKYLFDVNMAFSLLMNFSEVKFVDYRNKVCNFNSSDFKELLKIYKNMQPAIATPEIEEKYNYDPSKLLKNNIIAMNIDIMGSISTLYSENCLTNHELGENIEIIRITDSEKINTFKPIISE